MWKTPDLKCPEDTPPQGGGGSHRLFAECCSRMYSWKVDWKGKVWQGWLQPWEDWQEKLIQERELQNSWIISASPLSTGVSRKRATSVVFQGPSRSWPRNIIRVKVFFSDDSNFWISFGNQGPTGGRVEKESKLLEIQCEVSACHLLLLVHCFIKSRVSLLPGCKRALHASVRWPALWRCSVPFPFQDFAAAHCAKNYKQMVCWPW